jgi:hypothetical protein
LSCNTVVEGVHPTEFSVAATQRQNL